LPRLYYKKEKSLGSFFPANVRAEDAVRMRIAAVDLVSNTCFPALAAEELGFYKAEGLDAHVELFPMLAATKALRNGAADAMIAGSVHDLLTEFPRWEGVKLIVALSQGTPWLLVVRADLPARRGDLSAVKGLRLTAAEGPHLALRQMLIDARIDPDRDVEIVELPGAKARDVSFGVFAARALEAGRVDGFWANAMGSETAVRRGVGKILVDVRRGDDPAEVRRFTFAGLATTESLLERHSEPVAATVRAIVKTQRALRAAPALAAEVGRRRFPPEAAELIAAVVERDLPFYDPVIYEEAVAGLNRFACSIGHLPGPVAYDQVVAVRFRDLWVEKDKL
jgi:ABC-type nitrate/sulfonate/bicarbonate transport system substrate-binding protein